MIRTTRIAQTKINQNQEPITMIATIAATFTALFLVLFVVESYKSTEATE